MPRWTSDRRPRWPPGPTPASTGRHAARGRQLLHARLRRRSTDGGSSRARARELLRWLVRNSVLYALIGAWVLTRRWWEARTNARYERQMRAAEAAGDHDRLTEWEARASAPGSSVTGAGWTGSPHRSSSPALPPCCPWLVGGLLGLGAVLAVAHADLTWVLAPLATVVQMVAWLVWLADTVWRPLLITLGVLGAGRVVADRPTARARCPRWAAPANARVDATVVITPGGIATALAHLGIPALNRAVKDGWQVEFSTPPVRVNRRGYQAVFSLPMGVTPEMIADKRDVLARNLVRAPLEVWPAAAEHAGYVDLWVADPGSTERAAPPYPLLHDGRADVFDGVPLGVRSAGTSSRSSCRGRTSCTAG